MARRKGGEFEPATIDFAYRRANGKDEITGDVLGDKTEVDHILPLAWAILNAPDIPLHMLKSAKNARVLNRDTHKERHRNFDEAEAWAMVTYFRGLVKNMFDNDS